MREWQNRLVAEYVKAVKENDVAQVGLAAHNLAVHLAPDEEAFLALKAVLIKGARPGGPWEGLGAAWEALKGLP